MNEYAENRLNGISGLMRVKDDAQFIERCVESCIDALDELVVVYNDCSDDSAVVIEKMRQKYPEKIKVYEYKYKVFSVGLSKNEYEFVKTLPSDSPNLLCNYYNFALSKASYQYAMKIDADQLYFTQKLIDVRRMLLKKETLSLRVLLGWFLYALYRSSFRINRIFKKTVNLYGLGIVSLLANCYDSFAVYQTQRGRCALSLSGVNVFKDRLWYISLGKKSDIANVLPPFNGEYDHLIFKMSPECTYVPLESKFYNVLRNDSYSYIEAFKCPYAPIPIGFFWYHLNSMRQNIAKKILCAKEKFPEAFMSLDAASNESFSSFAKKIDKDMCPLNTLTLAAFNFAKDKKSISSFQSLLT